LYHFKIIFRNFLYKASKIQTTITEGIELAEHSGCFVVLCFSSSSGSLVSFVQWFYWPWLQTALCGSPI